jgi:hypothetical protein
LLSQPRAFAVNFSRLDRLHRAPACDAQQIVALACEPTTCMQMLALHGTDGGR